MSLIRSGVGQSGVGHSGDGHSGDGHGGVAHSGVAHSAAGHSASSRRLSASLAILIALAVAPLIGACTKADNPVAATNTEVTAASAQFPLVDAYIAAFNQHDPAAMAALMHPDLQVYYVDSNGVAALGTSGRDAMERELVGYFSQIPDVESSIAGSVVMNGGYRSYTERVTWTRDAERQVQSSLTVLQFEEDLLRRAWYYPATR